MKRKTLLSVLMLLALALAACAPAPTAAETSTASVPVTGETETPVVSVTETEVTAATTEAPTEAATEAPTTAATEATTGLTISTSSNPDVSEPFLVDDEGRTLYLFTNDTPNSGTSSCTGDCLAAWPAVVVTDAAIAGEGVDATLLGTITRDDGTMQATYNGWPLYYYASDVAPGDMLGQGLNDVWYLISGTGTAIQQ